MTFAQAEFLLAECASALMPHSTFDIALQSEQRRQAMRSARWHCCWSTASAPISAPRRSSWRRDSCGTSAWPTCSTASSCCKCMAALCRPQSTSSIGDCSQSCCRCLPSLTSTSALHRYHALPFSYGVNLLCLSHASQDVLSDFVLPM